MKELISVTIKGVLQIDVMADPNDESDVVDATYHALKDLNVSLDAMELQCCPQVFTEGLDSSDISFSTVDEEE